MALTQWDILFGNAPGPGRPAIIETTVNPIVGTKSLLMSWPNSTQSSSSNAVIRNDGAGVNANGFIRTLFRANQPFDSFFNLNLVGMMQGAASLSSICYRLELSGGSYAVRKVSLDGGTVVATIIASRSLPWTLLNNQIYAVGLIWQTQPGTGFVTISTVFSPSPGIVLPSYDFSTLVVDAQAVDSASPLVPGRPGVVFGTVSNPSVTYTIQVDTTQIC